MRAIFDKDTKAGLLQTTPTAIHQHQDRAPLRALGWSPSSPQLQLVRTADLGALCMDQEHHFPSSSHELMNRFKPDSGWPEGGQVSRKLFWTPRRKRLSLCLRLGSQKGCKLQQPWPGPIDSENLCQTSPQVPEGQVSLGREQLGTMVAVGHCPLQLHT